MILDNLPAHNGAAVRDTIEAAGARLLLPSPYSPDLDPIENAFAKLETLLRRTPGRSVEHLWRDIGKCLDASIPAEGAKDFAATGYDPCRSNKLGNRGSLLGVSVAA